MCVYVCVCDFERNLVLIKLTHLRAFAESWLAGLFIKKHIWGLLKSGPHSSMILIKVSLGYYEGQCRGPAGYTDQRMLLKFSCATVWHDAKNSLELGQGALDFCAFLENFPISDFFMISL